MKTIFSLLLFYSAVLTGGGCTPAEKTEPFLAAIDATAVRQVVNSAIAWQIDNLPTQGRAIWNHQYNGWADGVFLSAVAEWTQYDSTGGFRQWYRRVADSLCYEPGPRSVNPANDIAVSLTYANIWENSPVKEKYPIQYIEVWDFPTVEKLFGGWTPLIPTIERLDYQMKYCPDTDDSLKFENPLNQERWCWCDALYMAAPTYIKFADITGNREYLDFMEREFWLTTDVLYDKQEKLFYRDTRFFDLREKNGAKVFWGRGNGWVVGALARIVDLLPPDHPTLSKYTGLFQEMMPRIVSLQDEQGYWHTSLLDTENYTSPETSATGFYAYALWWGINRGYLDPADYLPAAKKAWEAMVAAVFPSGKLGYVQPIGDAPENITKDKNEAYGTAALAMAGIEVARYAENQ